MSTGQKYTVFKETATRKKFYSKQQVLNYTAIVGSSNSDKRERTKLKKCDFDDEANATTESDIKETLKKLVHQLKKSHEEVFDALKNHTVDLVLTALTQSVCQFIDHCFKSMNRTVWLSYMPKTSLLMIMRNNEVLHREIQAAFRTNEMRRTPPTP
ncbi:hypothetical protein CTI12_AA471920 [Artemisia annua]|uniref:Uncharacterized protein n=1 Tax=Artemisia annua TaxID=35608 RepID=A0A2U1LMY8_ARTAN|nr:hypothetical protein CTI12_AA471920 [Artemisia annua]